MSKEIYFDPFKATLKDILSIEFDHAHIKIHEYLKKSGATELELKKFKQAWSKI
jgi:hypothetical protein